MKPRSLHGRLVALLLGLLLGLGIALGWGLHVSSRLFFEEAHARLNGEVAEHVAKTLQPTPTGELLEKDLKALFMKVMVLNPSLEVYLIDPEGAVLAYDAPDEKVVRRRVDLAAVRSFLAGKATDVVRGDDPRSHGARKPISVHPVNVEGRRVGYLYVILGGQGHESIVQALRDSFVLRMAGAFLLGSLVVCGLIGFLSLDRLTRPLRRLKHKMERYRSRSGQPRRRSDDGDLRELEQTFTQMARRLDEQLEELAEKDERRREFVAGISHDLRTPASAIQGYLETLVSCRDRVPAEQREEHLRIALRQTHRLGRLINQLFELAKLEAREELPEREPFELGELVQDTVSEFQLRAERLGIALHARFPYDLDPVEADIGLIQRALDNLLENALRHSPRGGEVAVVLEPTRAGVLVEVRDTGQGVPADELPHLFDRYYRARGTVGNGGGLGLAITRRIIDLHEGTIDVESEPGEGTTFTFELPSRPPRARRHSIAK